MARQDGRWRKRRHDTYEEDNQLGVGQTLAYLKGQQHPAQPNVGPLQKGQESAQGSKDGGDDDDHNDDAAGEWQTVESRASKRRKKLPKMGAANYPSIAHSPHSRLQSYVKLADLQDLVLYLLADGPGPMWCSVAHHANVRKVVVLMVPGLEAGMFDGKIPFSQTDEKEEASSEEQRKEHTADSSAVEQSTTDATSSADASSSSQPLVSSKLIPTPDDYYPKPLEHERLPAQLQPFADMFEHIWPVKAPGDEKLSKMHSPLAAMLVSPLVKSKEEKRAQGPRPPRESKHWKDERTPVTEFIASTSELLEEGYVLHPAHYVDNVIAAEETSRRQTGKMTEADGWLDIPNIGSLSDGVVPDRDIEKGSILRGRKVLTLDCEMCVTSPPGIVPQIYSLTRISIVDWDGAVVMDEYVKPGDEITDYLTPYSGITPAKLEGVTTSLKDIQTKLATSIITPQTILVGHSLNSDLNALKLTHPYIIDTSILYPHPRGPPLKSGLKWLSKKYLLRDIQQGHGATGHDSVEDARACLDLVKQKCEKGKLWGTSDASNESLFKRLARYKRPKRDKVNPIGDDEPRLGAVVDWGDPNRGFGGQARVTIACKSDDDVVPGVLRALTGDAESDGGTNDDAGDSGGTEVSNGVSSGSRVPKGGVDFVFGRLHALEIHRGWNNRQYPTYTEGFNSNYPNANNASDDQTNNSSSSQQTLSSIVEATVSRISDLHASLPPCTAFIVYSGSSDPRPLAEMQALQQQFKEEYRVKKWDELSVKWTDTEEQKLKRAAREARLGVAFVGVK